MPKRKSTTPTQSLPIDDPRRRRLPPLLRSAWYSLNQAFRRRIAPLGLTPDQFTVLRWLVEAGEEGLTQRSLGQLMTSDANTIASLALRMERGGLVLRLPHQSDRRAKLVRPTPHGRNLYLRARRRAKALQEQVLGVIPTEEREPFLEHLEAVAAVCRELGAKTPSGNPRKT